MIKWWQQFSDKLAICFSVTLFLIKNLIILNFSIVRVTDGAQTAEEYEVIECDCDDCKAKMPCKVSGERVRRPESFYLYEI